MKTHEQKKWKLSKPLRMTARTFWKVAGAMYEAQEFAPTALFMVARVDYRLIAEQATLFTRAGMLMEIETPRKGVRYRVVESPFWALFKGLSPEECRAFWKKAMRNPNEAAASESTESEF